MISLEGYYLTTGRTFAHYNNAAQTKQTASLLEKHDEDVLLAPLGDEEKLGS